MGDEEEALPSPAPSHKDIPSRPTSSPRVSRRGVKLQLPTISTSSSEGSGPEKGKRAAQEEEPDPWYRNPLFNRVLLDMQWIPANFTWQKFHAVIRGTIVAFVSVLLLVIFKVEVAVGNVSIRRSDISLPVSYLTVRPASSFSSVCPLCNDVIFLRSKIVMVAAVLDPPIGSFIEVVEREVILIIAVCLGWACVFSSRKLGVAC